MLENFIVVAQQVLVLFILISLGFACGKKKIITDVSAKHINNLVLYFVTSYRAGADIYLTYFAKEIAKLMDEGRIG